MAFLLLKQVRDADIERLRNPKKRFDPNVSFAALDPANVVSVQTGAFSEFLLAEAGGFALTANLPPKRQELLIDLHALKVAWSRRPLYTRSV